MLLQYKINVLEPYEHILLIIVEGAVHEKHTCWEEVSMKNTYIIHATRDSEPQLQRPHHYIGDLLDKKLIATSLELGHAGSANQA